VSIYEGHGVTLHHGDCLDVLRSLPDCSVDSVVTDPPYGLEFMGKDWDGADGFRRSLNPNDAGRDNAFGRTSRTSPEYRTTSKAKAGMSGTGYTDGAERLERPSHMGGLNPKCRNCDKWQRGGNPCRCDAPDFPNERLPRLHTFQRWCEAWATECLRVLKPGGHLLAFGGTRTWHRLACAVEDAGFEVRDSIAWLYGCLSDDTEILTSEGWVRYDRAKEGQHALAFDTATGALAWQAIQHVHRYPYAGEMVRLRSEHTDQLLTPNHRVVLDEGRSTLHTPYVPSDQDLRRLLADVPGAQPLPVGAEDDVLAGVRGPADLAVKEGQDQASRRAGGPYGAVRDLQDGDVEAGRLAQAERGGVLLEPVQRCAPCGGAGEALPQGQGGLDRRQPGVLPGEDDRAEQPRMEGRRYRVQEARELCRSAVRASAGVGAADGPHGRVHHGAPATDGRPLRVPADQSGSHQPREPRSQGQPTGEPDPLAVEPGAQALRVGEDGGGRLLPSTGVTADVVDYAGVVWCITVPHGAFIARRNGLIFATGNSGFPKSLDVSKAIDKAQGATGTYGEPKSAAHAGWIDRGRMRGDEGEEGWQRPWMQDEGAVSNAARRYLPGSTEAQAFAGWGTALKPAFEPVVVARKPIQGTVAANVLAWGTGALNVDGCRIGEDGGTAGAGVGPQGDVYGDGLNGTFGKPVPGLGRWPANVVLDPECATLLDEQSGTLTSGANPTRRGADGDRQAYGEFGGQDDANPQRGADSGGASRFFFIAREDNPCHSTSSASTVESPSSHPRGPADSAPSDAATTACPDGERLTGSPSTSETPSASRPSVESGTTPTMSTAGASSPDWQPGEPSQMVSRARYAASLSRTATTTTTTSPSSSAGSVDPTTSSTTQASAPGVPLDELGSRFNYVAKADASERPRLPKRSLRLRDDLTPEQVDHVRARLVEAGVQVD
jgi:DNA modification methylase